MLGSTMGFHPLWKLPFFQIIADQFDAPEMDTTILTGATMACNVCVFILSIFPQKNNGHGFLVATKLETILNYGDIF